MLKSDIAFERLVDYGSNCFQAGIEWDRSTYAQFVCDYHDALIEEGHDMRAVYAYTIDNINLVYS